MIASAREPVGEGGAGLGAAFAAARTRLGLIALLFALAAVAWWSTVDRMRGMDEGPGTDLGTLGWFLGVWVVMMAAMMLPSVAPTVALYARLTKDRSPVAPLVFTSGYLLTWPERACSRLPSRTRAAGSWGIPCRGTGRAAGSRAASLRPPRPTSSRRSSTSV